MCAKKTQGVYIEVVVKPRAKKTRVPTRIEGNTIFVDIKAPPKGNKANKELLHELSNLFNTSQDRITIVSGHRSTKKIVFLQMDSERLKTIISRFKE
ncbi:MAG: DUF167 domain-containing protein [Promethearchaeota archaeon]